MRHRIEVTIKGGKVDLRFFNGRHGQGIDESEARSGRPDVQCPQVESLSPTRQFQSAHADDWPEKGGDGFR